MTAQLRFWGTRGSIPTPGPSTVRYGGNTPCVALTRGDDHLLVLDAGSGIRPLGHDLLLRGPTSVRVDLLLTHTHWDHIQGLPFFKPLADRDNRVWIHGAPQNGVSLEEILRRQMDPMVFPVPLQALGANITVNEIGEGAVHVDGYAIDAFRLRHPGCTLGYRIRPDGAATDVAYVTDNELGAGGTYRMPADWRARLVERLAGVDTLIHDTMFAKRMIEVRAGWGHSSPQQAVDLAAEAGCRRLLLFHHEPEHDDAAMDALLVEARAYAAGAAPGLVVDAAAEGLTIAL